MPTYIRCEDEIKGFGCCKWGAFKGCEKKVCLDHAYVYVREREKKQKLQLYCCEDCKEDAKGAMKSLRIAMSTTYNIAFLFLALATLVVIHVNSGINVFAGR